MQMEMGGCGLGIMDTKDGLEWDCIYPLSICSTVN